MLLGSDAPAHRAVDIALNADLRRVGMDAISPAGRILSAGTQQRRARRPGDTTFLPLDSSMKN